MGWQEPSTVAAREALAQARLAVPQLGFFRVGWGEVGWGVSVVALLLKIFFNVCTRIKTGELASINPPMASWP